MSERPEDPGPFGGEPPTAPPPPPPPAAPGTVDLRSETAVRSGGGIAGRVVAGVVGAVLLVGGVAFAATQLGNDGGAGDPEAAVRAMFDAIADEDVLGLLATLEPGERDAISAPVEQLFEELERLEVLDDSFDLAGIDGIDSSSKISSSAGSRSETTSSASTSSAARRPSPSTPTRSRSATS